MRAGFTFEWDPLKAAANLRKHGVAFDEATSVFGDPFSITIRDPDHSKTETRFLDLETSHKGRLLTVAYTERGRKLRIISARLATRGERREYEEEGP